MGWGRSAPPHFFIQSLVRAEQCHAEESFSDTGLFLDYY
jgi:hypothetical protein